MSKVLDWVDGEAVVRDMTQEEQDARAVSAAASRARMTVSRFQAKAALMQAGLLPQIETLMASADPIAQLAWAEAVEFRRDSPTIAALAASAGLSETQIDDLFRAAMSISA
ncbi:MAG: hypothetical protein EBT13_13795 [Rhodobacteraceae bacterium]|nr:hypothetical protein [Paracoccaceae bacterium]